MAGPSLSLRCPELCPAKLYATKVIYRIPKLDSSGNFLRPKPDKKKGWVHKGSHGKKARENNQQWHP
jgi:hypothetical protein